VRVVASVDVVGAVVGPGLGPEAGFGAGVGGCALLLFLVEGFVDLVVGDVELGADVALERLCLLSAARLGGDVLGVWAGLVGAAIFGVLHDGLLVLGGGEKARGLPAIDDGDLSFRLDTRGVGRRCVGVVVGFVKRRLVRDGSGRLSSGGLRTRRLGSNRLSSNGL
jgi:hypothetical protein